MDDRRTVLDIALLLLVLAVLGFLGLLTFGAGFTLPCPGPEGCAAADVGVRVAFGTHVLTLVAIAFAYKRLSDPRRRRLAMVAPIAMSLIATAVMYHLVDKVD